MENNLKDGNQFNPEVYILLLTYNQKSHTLECIKSLKKLDYSNYKIIVVDNGSSDGIADEIYKLYPEIILLRSKINLGCAAGRNLGIRYFLDHTTADFLFFLDNDTEVDNGLLKELVKVASETSADVFGMKVYYKGEPDKFWFAGGGRINWPKGSFYDSGQGGIDNGQFDKAKEIDSIPGGFTFIKREVLDKVGGLDERYFIYYEDPDWCLRVRKAGFKMAFAPKAKVWHKASSSLGIESPAFYYYRTRNRLLFVRENASRIYFCSFCLYFLYDFTYNTLLTLYRSGKIEQARAAIIGVFDFLRGRSGKRELPPEILRKPLLKTLILKFTDALAETIVSAVREVALFFKRLLKLKIRILVKLDWNLGDEIMASTVYRSLKERYPNSIINAKVKYPDLLLGNHFVDGINERMNWYDKIIDLRSENRVENRQAHLERVLGFSIRDRKPRVYIGNDEELMSCITGIDNHKIKVAISTGANWNSRQWGAERFKKVAEHLTSKYDLQLIELGKDCESVGIGLNLVNKTTIREAAILLKHCSLFIGNDSGLVHLALAVCTPTVGLFGPLDPGNLVCAENQNFISLKADIDCRFCWSRGLMLYPDCCPRGIPVCMAYISVANVITAAESLLDAQRNHR